MVQPLRHFYTSEEYLAFEEEAAYKSEYYDGTIFKMAGATDVHSQIVFNLAGQLYVALRKKPCRSYIADMKVQILSGKFYFYPDVMVVCGEVMFVPKRTDAITNPNLIIEVLSESTKDYDRGEKFELYRTLASFQDYILIDQKRIYIEVHQKQAEGVWQMKQYTDLSAVIKAASIDFEISSADIYEGVQFTQAEPKSKRAKRK